MTQELHDFLGLSGYMVSLRTDPSHASERVSLLKERGGDGTLIKAPETDCYRLIEDEWVGVSSLTEHGGRNHAGETIYRHKNDEIAYTFLNLTTL